MIDRRNISNLYPLSSLQEGMLYHALREPESRAYFEQIDFEVPGPLNADAYLQAWQDLVNRHDILRTVFAVRKLPQPLQIVLRNAPLPVVHEDLRAQAEDIAEARIADYRSNDLAQGFDLTEAVPMRLALFTLPGERHRVVWSFHHILLDGWSLAILQSDLDALYASRQAGRIAQLLPAAPYSAYIKWLGKRDRKEGLSFWQGRLQGLELPTPLPRRLDARFLREIPSYSMGECRHPLNPQAQAELPRLAARHGVTVNIVVQCLWGMLLARLNGRRDAAFAATVSGRPTELEDAGRTVGIFINAVPVRMQLRAGETFAALLARIQSESIEAQAYHDCPLAEVQADHPLREALFDHILVFENYPQLDKPAQPSAPDAVNLHEYTHYHFEFQFLPGSPPVLRFRFHQGLFDPAVMAGIAQDFEALLLTAAQDPHQPAETLALPPSRWTPPASIAIAASFTAEPVAESLGWWLSQFACPTEVRLAPYNQCVQQLGDPHSLLQDAPLGVLLLRFTDAARDLSGLDQTEACARLDAQYDMLLQLLNQRGGKPLLTCLLPSAPSAGPLAAHVQALEQRWCDALRSVPGVTILDMRALAEEFDLDEVFDAAADRIGHLPFSTAACDAIAAQIARAVVARARPPFKVIAVDCDNTLWAGVVGEAGPLGVRIDDGHRDLQRFLVEKQQQGFLIALASKNREEDVWAVFDRHPDMILRREHIAAAVVNWQRKSDNLKQLAAHLNLGVDSIVFIDDSPVECSEVMEHCPDALAIPLPADAALYGAWLSRVWAVDQTAVTTEDRERTGMMQAESRRQAALGESAAQDFLEQLQLKVKVGPVQAHQRARVAQLTQRTNQFNLSGRRRDETEITALMAEPGVAVLAIEVEDRFGAYGLTGVAIVHSQVEALQVDTLLLSCRVLGRKVEHALLVSLARRALALGCRQIEAPLTVTERNEPVRLFLSAAPWRDAGNNVYLCEVQDGLAEASCVELLDDYLFVAPGAANDAYRNQEVAPHAASVPAHAPSSPRLPETFPLPIRNEASLRHGLQYLPLLAACAGWPRTRLRTSTQAATRNGRMPAADTEQIIAAIWSEVLGREINDAEAGFAELGGHSLHAVRAVSRLERSFQCELGLSKFFSLNSIAALAAWFDARPRQADGHAVQAIPRAPDAPDYPLSHNQQRLWILSRMGAADNLYNLCAAFRLRGALNAAALRRAVQRLVEHHEALRTVVRLRNDEPRQAVIDAVPENFIVFADAAGREEQGVRAHIVERSRMPFELEAGPLFRVELHSMHSEDQVLAIYLHHIIGDGWSFGLLLDALARFYAIEAGMGGGEQPPPALRYRDFAVWNRSGACEPAMAGHRDYWRSQLHPLAPIAQVPQDFMRPPTPGGEGGVLTRLLPLPASALQAWCAQRRATLFPLLSSLVAVLLYRCGSESTVRLGMPVAGRDRPELDTVVGFFANTTVLTAQLHADRLFAELMAEMHQHVTGALEHQSYPFDRLVSDLQPEREPGRNPLFDALVVLQNARGNAAGLPGVEIDEFAVETGLSAFDLVFEFGPGGKDELVCALRYRRDLYRDDTAECLLERLLTLLNAVLAAPATKLQELALIGSTERARLDACSAGGSCDIPDASLSALFAQQAARSPEAIALSADTVRLDYRTLDRRANALASALRSKHGIAEGDVVAVMLERTVDWPVALLGVMKAGAVYLPLDLRHPPARLRELLQQSGARGLVASRADQGIADGLDIALTAPLAADAQEPDAPAIAVSAMDPAYMLFTSGSTGVPKGVRVHHRAFVNMILAQIRGFGIESQDTVLHLASCAFDASLSEFFMAWLCGAGVAIADHASTRDSALLAQAIARHGATVATITPSHLRQLDDADIAGLRKIILAAEAVLGRDARRLQALGIECFNAYGPTETAVCATLMRIDTAPADATPVPIGRPLPNLALHIVDIAGRDTPLGVPGEILVQGEGVALGYLHEPKDADSPFFTLPDGTRAYRTGDIGRWLGDGNIEYLGRKDAQVKIRGHRVEPGEVAAALTALEDVRQAEVVAEQGAAGTYLAAYLCGERQADAVLRARLADRLPPHMMPARFVWLERMPLTTSGKLDRSALPQLSTETQNMPISAEPLNASESAVLAVWRELLPGQVGIDTDFFDAGGNSLLAMRAARHVTAGLGRDCSALQFFRTPTVRSMAAALDGGRLAPSLQAFGSGPVQLLALPPHPGLDLGYAALARALPEATLHAVPFIDQPVAALIDVYAGTFDKLANGKDVLLLGYSAGGKLALALAHELERRGRGVRAVVLIDTWSWSGAEPGVRSRIDEEMHAAMADGQHAALAAAYRARLSDFEPSGAVNSPVHHLLANEVPVNLPSGLSRDWSALSASDYFEYALQGSHHRLLDATHVTHTAVCLRTILKEQSCTGAIRQIST